MIRRSLLALSLLLLLAPAPTLAQSMGRIYYQSRGTLDFYCVNGDGTNQAVIANPPATLTARAPSARSDYPGGRLFFYSVSQGQIPGLPSGFTYGDFHVWNEGGVDKQLTNFRGPLYVTHSISRTIWSNDGQDSFFSFFVYDTSTTRYAIYRANVSAAEITDPLVPFTPIAPGDPRLEPIVDCSTVVPDEYAWDHSGTKLHYIDGKLNGATDSRLRAHLVGPDLSQSNDPVLFDAGLYSVTGRSLNGLDASPTADLLVTKLQDKNTKGTPRLILVDSNTGAWTTLLADVPDKAAGISSSLFPQFSPDGSFIAFGARRYVKKGSTYVYGVYTLSTSGGLYYLLTESPSDGAPKWTTGWRW